MTNQTHLYQDLCEVYNRISTILNRVDPLGQHELTEHLYEVQHHLDKALDTFPVEVRK